MTAGGWPSRNIDVELQGSDPGWIGTLFHHLRTLMVENASLNFWLWFLEAGGFCVVSLLVPSDLCRYLAREMASEEKVAAIVEGGDGDAKGADDAAAADADADATIAAAAPPATALTTHDLGDGVTLVVSPPADYNGTSDSAKVS